MRQNFTYFYLFNNINNNEKTDNFSDFDDIFNILNKNYIEPSKSVINRIIDFSKSYKVIKSSNCEYINLDLN